MAISSWVVKEDFNKTKLTLEIPREVLGKTGERDKISSKLFCVGRSKFSLEVQPRFLPARDGSKMGWVTLYNESNHSVVTFIVKSDPSHFRAISFGWEVPGLDFQRKLAPANTKKL